MRVKRFDSLGTDSGLSTDSPSLLLMPSRWIHRLRWTYHNILPLGVLFNIVTFGVCLAAAVAGEEETAKSPTPPDPIIAAVAEAKRTAQPIRAAEASAAKARLREAVARLSDRLKRDKDQGGNWRNYLQLADLEAELSKSGEPSWERLNAVLARFSAGHEGLKLTCFSEVREALRQYMVRSRAVDDASLPEKLGQILDPLPGLVESYQASHDPAVASSIQAIVGWLELMDRGQPVVAAVRERFARPNLFVEVSAEFLAKGFTAPVDTSEPVREIILGTDVRGTGHITGDRTLRLMPASNRAELAIVVTGSIAATTIGYNGPARIYSQGETPFTARKVVRISAAGVEILPAQADARTRTKINDVDVTCRARCVEKIAWKRTFQQKPLAEMEASRRAEIRLDRRIDEEADARLKELQTSFEGRLRRPLLDRGLFPEKLDFRSDESRLQVESLFGGLHSQTASSAPPAAHDGDIDVRLHQTFFNNMAEGALSGMLVREERLREIITDLLGKLPPELETEDEQPWAVRFPQTRPICVQFDNGRAVVQFRGQAYQKGDAEYTGMDVTAAYRLEQRDGGFVLVREGDPTAFPPNFDPQNDRLSVRQQTLRRLLERRFGKIFRSEIALEPIALEGEWAAVGPLTVTYVVMDDGWLTLSLRSAPTAPVGQP